MIGRRIRAAAALLAGVACVAVGAVSAQTVDPDVRALLAQAGVREPAVVSCRGEFRLTHPTDVAVALQGPSGGGGRYVVVQDDGKVMELATYDGKPDLSCYTLREADRLNDTIAKSTTINGRVVAEWDGHVVCGFIDPTIAECWQFAPEQGRFVRIGGWTT